MVFQDPYFHALRRRLQATPYDQLRRRFTQQLRTIALPPHLPHLSAEELSARENWLYSQGLDLYLPILRTILRAIRQHVEAGIIESGELDPEQLAMATYETARAKLRSLQHLPRDRFAWPRRLARKVVHQAALARHSERLAAGPLSSPPSLTAPIPVEGATRLYQALADPDLPLPDDLLEDPSIRSILDQLLDRLPAQWREIYLLAALDRWNDEQIAAVSGLLPDEIRAIIHATV